ncbi:hypothetical protein HMPREF0185_02878 [Brevundimonas diminuta 470-4]|nr:hypothetical protein HMPREF0185_02878 [Brevundimonas diminuta 470-4]
MVWVAGMAARSGWFAHSGGRAAFDALAVWTSEGGAVSFEHAAVSAMMDVRARVAMRRDTIKAFLFGGASA